MNIYERIAEIIQTHQKAVLVTAVEKKGQGPAEAGFKMLVMEDGKTYGTVGGGKLELTATEQAKTLFKTKKPIHQKYLLNDGEVLDNAQTLSMVCGGTVTLYYEYIGSPLNVYIFGAGHVGQALMHVLEPLNYHVTVIDEREDVLAAFKGGTRKVHKPYAQFVLEETLSEDSYIVICTPSHAYDYEVLNAIFNQNIQPKYMGMLCSPKKLNAYLTDLYKDFPTIDLQSFYSPIGLDLGGGSPGEIAISIAAEILMIHHGKAPVYSMRESRQGKYQYWTK